MIAANAEAVTNWYISSNPVQTDYFDRFENIQAAAAQAERSWLIVSVFTDYLREADKIKQWLREQPAVKLTLDPVITVYYVGHNVDQAQLLKETQQFALPVDHDLYARLAQENSQAPVVARRYYRLALEHAPTDELRAQYQAALDALPGQ